MQNNIKVQTFKYFELNQNLKNIIYSYLDFFALIKVFYVNKKMGLSVNKNNKHISRNSIKIFFFLHKLRYCHFSFSKIDKLNIINNEDVFLISFKKFTQNKEIALNEIVSGFVLFIEYYISLPDTENIILHVNLSDTLPPRFLEVTYELIKLLNKERVYYHLDIQKHLYKSKSFYRFSNPEILIKFLSHMKYVYLHDINCDIYEILLKNKIEIFFLRDEEIIEYPYEGLEIIFKSEYFSQNKNSTETFIFNDKELDFQFDYLGILKNNSKSIKYFYVENHLNFNMEWLIEFDKYFPVGLPQLNNISLINTFPFTIDSKLFKNMDSLQLVLNYLNMDDLEYIEGIETLFSSILQNTQILSNLKFLKLNFETFNIENLSFNYFVKLPNLESIEFNGCEYDNHNLFYFHDFLKFEHFESSIDKLFELLNIILKNKLESNFREENLFVKVSNSEYLIKLLNFLEERKFTGIIKNIKAIEINDTNNIIDESDLKCFYWEHLKYLSVSKLDQINILNNINFIDCVTIFEVSENLESYLSYLKGKRIQIIKIHSDKNLNSLKFITNNLSDFKYLRILEIESHTYTKESLFCSNNKNH